MASVVPVAARFPWWNDDWEYRLPVEIMIMDPNYDYDNYFMAVSINTTNLIKGGKLKPDLSDLRMTNEYNEEIDIKIMQHPNGNASIWFGFTGTPPEATMYYIYYSNPAALPLPYYPFSHWGNDVTGDDFDDETTDVYPSTWMNDPGGNTRVVEGEWYHSGTPSGKKSFYVNQTITDARAMPIPYEKGIFQAYFNFKTIGGAGKASSLGEIANSIGRVFQLMLSEGCMEGYNLCIELTNGVYTGIGTAMTDTDYFIRISWDGENTFWTVKGEGIDASDSGGYKYPPCVPYINRKVGGENAFYVDDYIVRNVPTLNEPTATLGDEEERGAPSLIAIKSSGEFDYLQREEIYVSIASLVTDKDTGETISGATVFAEIYNPNGLIIFSNNMTEIQGTGIYVIKSPDTIKNLYTDELGKGVYLARIEASYKGRVATDMIEFHIDPPGGSTNLYPLLLLALIAFVLYMRTRTRTHTL